MRKFSVNKTNEVHLVERDIQKTILASICEGVILTNNQNEIVFINEVAEQLTGWNQNSASNKPLEEVVNIFNEYTGKRFEIADCRTYGSIDVSVSNNSAILISKDYIDRLVEYSTIPIKDCKGTINGIMMVLKDITDKKQKQKQIEFLNFYDQLTGLYNRKFYETELLRIDVAASLPITIVMCDVNGLKLINDSFGHTIGDKVLKKFAESIKMGCRLDDIIARIGGDEFAIILPKTSAFDAERIIRRIKDLILKKAEDHMYSAKLFESPSMHGKTVKTIIKTLYEKNKREEQHSQRVSMLCERMGEALRLSDYVIKELKTIGLLHDIGKIAIDENILNKSSKLTDDEWREIKRHSEIGFRILSTVSQMKEIAEIVLTHHERWDGQGYPHCLKGEEIPFEARIIAIADAYDAMTSERSYRPALSVDSAVVQLNKNAAIQFDPELVDVFIKRVLLIN